MSKLNPTNAVNQPDGKKLRSRSRFDLTHNNYQTFRFGEYSPHFCLSTVPSDNINLKCEHSARTLSLKAPLMSSISMKKDYFNIPMEAILPKNWEKVYKNPVNGDDVESSVGVFVPLFLQKIRSSALAMSNLVNLADANADYDGRLTYMFKALLYCEQFFSTGSLFNNLGAKLNRYFHSFTLKGVKGNFNFDQCFDIFIAEFLKAYNDGLVGSGGSDPLRVIFYDFDGQIDEVYYLTLNDDNDANYQLELAQGISFRDFLEKVRSNSNWKFADSDLTITDNTGMANVFAEIFQLNNFVESARGLNLARPLAYQLCCAHYYSSDNVDYIYTAELYRELMGAYIRQCIGLKTFEYNGVTTDYDYLSGEHIAQMFDDVVNAVAEMQTLTYIDDSVAKRLNLDLCFFNNIFAFRRSLRYRDYFVGARTQPLAVGNVDVAVDTENANVSVIDVTRNIQKQRFLNAVNRVGNKIEAYLKELFGVVPAYDFHNPAWLGHTDDTVGHYEVQNTADAQQTDPNSITSIMRSNASKAAFSFSSDRPSILIGITWFDIPRVYTYTIDKEIMHEDRFDMFNPYAQYIGDQPIAIDELGFFNDEKTDKQTPFAYTIRYMEYKQKVDTASGGFVADLPGWAFLGDTKIPTGRNILLSPDFVRSKNSDLDDLYLRLSGYSLGKYFHFAILNTNYVTASRPMAFAPTIL